MAARKRASEEPSAAPKPARARARAKKEKTPPVPPESAADDARTGAFEDQAAVELGAARVQERAAAVTLEAQETAAELLQLVTFVLSGEEYAFPIMGVQEILRMRSVSVTAIPNSPSFIEGVMNLRGRVIPVIDLRSRFGLPVAERGRTNRVIVVEVSGRTIGVVVDAVVEVVRIDARAIEPLPELVAGIGSEFIVGVTRAAGRLVVVLDMERVFSPEEKSSLGDLVA